MKTYLLLHATTKLKTGASAHRAHRHALRAQRESGHFGGSATAETFRPERREVEGSNDILGRKEIGRVQGATL